MDGDVGEDRTSVIRALLADILRVSSLVLPQIGNRFAAELGASLAELDLLAELKHSPQGRLRMSEISDKLTISTTSVTRLVDQLERRGYAERVLSHGDRRVVYAVLTQEGAELLTRADPVSGPALEDCFGRHFKTSEMAEMRTMLDRVLVEAGGDLAESAKDGDLGSESAVQGL